MIGEERNILRELHMSKQALHRAAAANVIESAAGPSPGHVIDDLGQAGSKDALARISDRLKEFKAVAAAPILKRAIEALNREDFEKGSKFALEALQKDEENGVGWYLLGIARERAGDFPNSIKAYEAALRLVPDHAEVANDLGRLAYRMGMHDQAEKLFRHFIAHAPDRPDGVNNLASVISDGGRVDEAIDLLKDAIMARPDSAMLWNTLGSAMIKIGDLKSADAFFLEAIRLEPNFSKARHNLGQVKFGMGDPAGALADCEMALKPRNSADDRQMMLLAHASYQLALGRLAEGWDAYETRLSPQYAEVTHYLIDRPKWEPDAELAGKTLLVVGEQGLGDEILFANVLPDVIERLGPDGKLLLAVERRLVELFQRSFPHAAVTAHDTRLWAARGLRSMPGVEVESVDLWAPIASLLREFRRSVDAFPNRPSFLKADPKRVAHWKRVLIDAPPGPKVGLLWKSAIDKDARHRFFSPFQQWEPVLRTHGVSFVNLQYGDCTEELARAEQDFGVKIWNPAGIDLKQDLDDVAALCCAMDLVIGFSNATFNLGAACGAASWLLSPPRYWTLLGSDGYPWYPQALAFEPPAYGEWAAMMEKVAEALAVFASDAER